MSKITAKTSDSAPVEPNVAPVEPNVAPVESVESDLSAVDTSQPTPEAAAPTTEQMISIPRTQFEQMMVASTQAGVYRNMYHQATDQLAQLRASVELQRQISEQQRNQV